MKVPRLLGLDFLAWLYFALGYDEETPTLVLWSRASARLTALGCPREVTDEGLAALDEAGFKDWPRLHRAQQILLVHCWAVHGIREQPAAPKG